MRRLACRRNRSVAARCQTPAAPARSISSAEDGNERHHLAGLTAEVVRQGEVTLAVRADPPLLRCLPTQLQPGLEHHPQAGCAGRVTEALETTVRVDRQVTGQVERAGEDFLP